jgi:hypothetical protein
LKILLFASVQNIVPRVPFVSWVWVWGTTFPECAVATHFIAAAYTGGLILNAIVPCAAAVPVKQLILNINNQDVWNSWNSG